MSEDGPQSFSAEHHSRALLNILEDSAEEKQRLQDTQKAFLNILEDFGEEKQLLEDTQRAMLNILEDLDTEKRTAEAASRMKSAFLANMSHELRTPLNAIIGFAKLMYHGKVGPMRPEHREYLGDILNSSSHLLLLINDVLDLAKLEAGQMTFHPESIDLEELVVEVRDSLRAVAATKRIDVSVEVYPECKYAYLDASKLRQVLYNYLSNALKFTEDEGTVMAKVMPEGTEHIRIEVSDTGIGIEPKDLEHLFREFRQLDSSSSKRYAGTGLGLALTRKIVEAQGGQTGAISAPGVGSTFYAVLPWTKGESV